MNINEEKKQLLKTYIIIASVAAVVVIMIAVAKNISDGLINKSRLSSAMQTMKSISTVLAGCQIGNMPIFPPNDVKNPTNFPCLDSTRYAVLGGNSTANCLYNTSFVSTITERVVTGGAIQAGCECADINIDSCKHVFQCDFATTGKCSEKNSVN